MEEKNRMEEKNGMKEKNGIEEAHETFTYTYSATQQEEIKRIRKKYTPPTREEDKMERLRKLDRDVTRHGLAAAWMVGVVSTLVLGVGMCCTMVWDESLFVPGIVIGVLGIFGICAAYPLYLRVTQRQREKLAPEIMRLTDELMK